MHVEKKVCGRGVTWVGIDLARPGSGLTQLDLRRGRLNLVKVNSTRLGPKLTRVNFGASRLGSI